MTLPVDAVTLIPAAFIIMAAALVKSTTGFGFALVATPLLLIFWEPKVMVPVMFPVSITIDIIVVAQNWRRLAWKRVLPMIAAGSAGIPLGTYILLAAPQQALRVGAAGLVLVAALILMTGFTVTISRERVASAIAGFLSGVLSASTTIGGPPVVLFMVNQKWAKETFRTSLCLFFLAMQVLAIVSLTATGTLNVGTLKISAILWPAMMAGYAAATRILPHIPQRAFLRIAAVIVMTTAVIAMVNALR